MPLVEFKTASGDTVYVEADETSSGPVATTGPTLAGRGGGRAAAASPRGFDEALGQIKTIGDALAAKVLSLDVKPAEVEATLGFKLSAEVGIFVAQSKGEASLQIKLKWKPGA